MRIRIFIVLACLFTVAARSTGLDNRAKRIIDYTADAYMPPSLEIGDPEKYYFPVALARFNKYGLEDELANSYVELLAQRGVFHFSSVGLVRIVYQYAEAPAVKLNLKDIIRHHLEGNLWVSEGTENHLHMERTSGFLIAQLAMKLFPENKAEAEIKYNQMYHWILDWSIELYRHGEAEWNSAIYHAYSLISWLNVFDYAEAPEIKEAARKVIDYYVAEMALHYHWGTIGGAEMRGTGVVEKNHTATNYLAWYWFGGDRYGELGMSGSQVIQSIHAILSSYRPNKIMCELAHKEGISDSWYMNSKPSYLFEEHSYVKQFLYLGKMYALGSCVSGYGGYTGACHQIVPWKLVIGRTGKLPWEISGNGGYYNNWTGKTRDPYTQHVQYKNVLIQLTKTPMDVERKTHEIYAMVDTWAESWAEDYTKRFGKLDKPNVVTKTPVEKLCFDNISFINLPETAFTIQDQWLVADMGEIYLAVYFFNSLKRVENEMDTGRLLFSDSASRGQLCGYVLEVVEKGEEIASSTELITLLSERNPTFSLAGEVTYHSVSGFTIAAQYGEEGTFTEPVFDWGFGVTRPATLTYTANFKQPLWPTGKGFGKVPAMKVNGEEILFSEPWPVFNGKEVRLENQILTIVMNGKEYKVEY